MKKKTKTASLSKAELLLISDLLYWAADAFGERGLCEYKIPATEENKNIITTMMKNHDESQDDIDEVFSAKDEIETFDFDLANYLGDKCRKLATK